MFKCEAYDASRLNQQYLFRRLFRYDWDIGGYIRCFIFDSNIAIGIGTNGSIIGLQVITFERYFKVVHAVLHKRYFRPWMTKVAVALPWAAGILQVCKPLFYGFIFYFCNNLQKSTW